MHWAESTLKRFFAHRVNAETISLLAESTLNEFSRMLSQQSNFDNFFMDILPNAPQRRTNFIAVCVNAETISLQTESMQKRFYH
jgi:hypothetical protein